MAPSVALPIALYRKTGPISVVWKSLYSCPVGCQHLQDGTCYSLHGTCKFTTYRLTSCAEHDPETICKRSAELILGLASTVRRRDAEKIRLNISGDSPFPHHDGPGIYTDTRTGLKTIACRHDLTKSVTCRDCNLCEEGTMKRGGYQAVAFAMKHAK